MLWIPHVYVVVCEDMPASHQAVQAVHAGIAAGRDLVNHQEPNLVLCTVPTQHDLIALSVQLTKANIAHRVFREEDMGGRPTALGTRPVTGKERRLFAGLPLYKAPEAARAA